MNEHSCLAISSPARSRTLTDQTKSDTVELSPLQIASDDKPQPLAGSTHMQLRQTLAGRMRAAEVLSTKRKGQHQKLHCYLSSNRWQYHSDTGAFLYDVGNISILGTNCTSASLHTSMEPRSWFKVGQQPCGVGKTYAATLP